MTGEKILIVTIPRKLGTELKLKIKYRGKPILAQNAAWDGGFVMPFKDLMCDLPGLSVSIHYMVTNTSKGIRNGRFIDKAA